MEPLYKFIREIKFCEDTYFFCGKCRYRLHKELKDFTKENDIIALLKTFKIDHFIRHEEPHKHKNIYLLLMALSEERTNECNWPKCKPISSQELQNILDKWFIDYGHIVNVSEWLSKLTSSLPNSPNALRNK